MIPVMLYPETHFRFGGISPSLLFKKEPEIIFDMPARVLKGVPLPLFLLINDIDTYPIELCKITVGLYQSGKNQTIEIDSFEQYECSHPTSFKTKAYEFPIDYEGFDTGRVTITPILHINIKGRQKEVVTDNLRFTSHSSLLTYIAKKPYPGSNTCSYGDMHCHSIHSRSHVEFGAPIPFYKSAAKSVGLDIVSIIDHTYDLEAKPENYLHRDPELKNWNLQQSQKEQSPPLILLSQEHSARKNRGGVVHMGVLGYSHLLRGSGDGARKEYKRSIEPSLETASKEVTNKGGITFAAHPGEPTTLMQRIFLRRDNWKASDFTPNITAIQALNRGVDASWFRARKLWISLLLKGKKLPLIAGNDAHGDFNRYRAIAYPFIQIREEFHRFFGLARTGFYGKITSEEELITAIIEGKTFITTGPFIDIQQAGHSKIGNIILPITDYTLVIKSSCEFGFLQRIRVHIGTSKGEKAFLLPLKEDQYRYEYTITTKEIEKALYLRAEVDTTCGDNGLESFAATSPLYFYSATSN